MYEAERGLFELRRRRPLHVRDGGPGGGVVASAVEGLTDAALDSLRSLGAGAAHLVVTAHRARVLGFDDPGPATSGASVNGHRNGRPTDDALALVLPDAARASDLLALCSAPVPPRAHPDSVRAATAPEAAVLRLARAGHLLPAVVAVSAGAEPSAELARLVADGSILGVGAEAVRALLDAPRLSVVRVSDAPVPLRDTEDARFILFREESGLLEHVAILVGEREAWPDPVPVRLHSACLTGDLFGSLRCDCGEQLRGSLRYFAARGGGVLLYLAQEGRGIGLANKLRAYTLQESGLDTIDADCSLGFGPDERTYDAALEMLRHLGIDRVHLLTNNPEKVRAVERGGVRVLSRQPLHGTLNRHNRPYVEAKVRRAGHWLEDMLSGATRPGA